MDATGTLRLVFDADAWDSTISFAAGIPVTRAGTLELLFAPEVNLAAQIGRTIDLFNWSGVTPTGTFTVSSPYSWNLSNLYTTGEVTLTAVPGVLPGDFNNNGVVDAADYVVWRDGLGSTYVQSDYEVWRANFGRTAGSGAGANANANVPEPNTLLMLVLAATGSLLGRRRTAWRVPATHRRATPVNRTHRISKSPLVAFRRIR